VFRAHTLPAGLSLVSEAGPAPISPVRSGSAALAGEEGPVSTPHLWHSQVGGFDGVDRLQTVEAYSPAANEWHTVPRMLSPRSNFGIEVVDDWLFAVGGFNGFMTTFNAEYYDEKANEWHDVQDMGINRSALSCCVVPGLPNIREYVAR